MNKFNLYISIILALVFSFAVSIWVWNSVAVHPGDYKIVNSARAVQWCDNYSWELVDDGWRADAWGAGTPDKVRIKSEYLP